MCLNKLYDQYIVYDVPALADATHKHVYSVRPRKPRDGDVNSLSDDDDVRVYANKHTHNCLQPQLAAS